MNKRRGSGKSPSLGKWISFLSSSRPGVRLSGTGHREDVRLQETGEEEDQEEERRVNGA